MPSLFGETGEELCEGDLDFPKLLTAFDSVTLLDLALCEKLNVRFGTLARYTGGVIGSWIGEEEVEYCVERLDGERGRLARGSAISRETCRASFGFCELEADELPREEILSMYGADKIW